MNALFHLRGLNYLKNVGAPLRQFGKKRKRPNGFWASAENRRKVFCEFAEEMGFDPLLPENWNNITWQQVCSMKASTHPTEEGSFMY